MKLKRLCAATLAVIMSLTMLGGCGKKAGGTAGTKVPGSEAGTGAALGRYMEEEIALPDKAGEDDRSVQLVQREDGRVFLYAYMCTDQADVLCYEWTKTGWEEHPSGLDQAGLEGEGNYIVSVWQADDGTEYMIYTDWTTYNEEDNSVSSYILKADPDGNQTYYTDAPITAGSIDFAHIFSDGSLLASSYANAIHYLSDGKERELIQGGAHTDIRTLAAAGKMEYITISPEENSLLRYNMENDSVSETIPLVIPETGAAGDGVLALDGEGNVYMCNSAGIHYWKKGGSIWETLVDGNLVSLSKPSLAPENMVLGLDNDYLILINESGSGSAMLRFYYDPDVTAVPTNTLSIFGLSDNPTIRQTISQFQKQNPDVRVDFQIGSGGDGSAAVTDTIKALNTELINKKGADILILDGLPIDDYIEKGVLADMGDMVNPMLEDNTLMNQIAGVMKQEDNSVYGIPVRFLYPIMFGNDEGMAAMQSLQTVRDYNGSLPLLANKNHTEILKYLMNLYYTEIFNDDGTISKEHLVLLLEASKSIHDRGLDPAGNTNEFNEVYNTNTEFGMSSSDSYNVYIGDTAVALLPLDSVRDLMLPAEIMVQLGLKPSTANGIFFPSQIVGVNQSSNHKELANEFIRLLLSAEIQSVDLYDGFPINTEAFDRWRTFRDENISIATDVTTDDGASQELLAEWPAQEQQDEIFALLTDMTVPVLTDSVLTEMITDEANAYFDGTADAPETADAIINRAELYFGE